MSTERCVSVGDGAWCDGTPQCEYLATDGQLNGLVAWAYPSTGAQSRNLPSVFDIARRLGRICIID